MRTWYQNTSASGPVYSEHYYEYDDNGRLVKQTSLSLTNNYVRTSEFEYDNNGNMIAKRETNDRGSWEYTHEYDEFGNLMKEFYSGTSTSPSRTTTYTYDYIYTLE